MMFMIEFEWIWNPSLVRTLDLKQVEYIKIYVGMFFSLTSTMH